MTISLEDELTEFHTAIGKAITEWSAIEDTLAKLFATALRVEDHGPAWAAFYAVINFNSKLDMLDAALAAHFIERPDLFEKWSEFKLRTSKRNKFRVKLAHHQVFQFLQAKPGQRVFLSSTIYDPAMWSGGKSTRHFTAVNEVRAAYETFKALNRDLALLNVDFRYAKVPPPTSYDMLGDAKLPQSLTAKSRKKPQTPPQSSAE